VRETVSTKTNDHRASSIFAITLIKTAAVFVIIGAYYATGLV